VSAIKPKGFSTIATAFAGQEDSDPNKASVGVKPSGAETHPRWHHRNRSHQSDLSSECFTGAELLLSQATDFARRRPIGALGRGKTARENKHHASPVRNTTLWILKVGVHRTSSGRGRVGGGNARSRAWRSSRVSSMSRAAAFCRTWEGVPARGMALTPSC